MTEVAQGTSLARFGDGELQIMGGKDANHQKYSDKLAGELEFVFNGTNCLVGVPHTRGIRAKYWKEFLRGQYWHISQTHRTQWYGSAFVSRHDEVPWTEEYCDFMRGFCERETAIVVAPVGYPIKYLGDHIVCASENTYDDIDEIETTLINQHPQLAILCCGPTATVLADRLARKGIWAVDLGNFGKFL